MAMLIGWSLCRVVTPGAWRNLRNVHLLVGQFDFAVYMLGARRLQPIGVVALREFRFVVSAARFIASQGSKRDNPRQEKHVSKFAREIQRLIRPHGAVAQIYATEAFREFQQLRIRFL